MTKLKKEMTDLHTFCSDCIAWCSCLISLRSPSTPEVPRSFTKANENCNIVCLHSIFFRLSLFNKKKNKVGIMLLALEFCNHKLFICFTFKRTYFQGKNSSTLKLVFINSVVEQFQTKKCGNDNLFIIY